jgi:nucleolar protein 56
MIEIAGSFERLSRYPASTIQLLGSEKSFFKALKFNKKTPKYGILYNHPLIINLTNKKKAKIARSLASKIALGLKADVEKKDISKDLINKIKTKISEINE